MEAKDLHSLAESFLARFSASNPLPSGYKSKLIRFLSDKLDQGHSISSLGLYITGLRNVSLATPIQDVFRCLPTAQKAKESIQETSEENLFKRGNFYFHTFCREERKPVYSQIAKDGSIEFTHSDTTIQLKEELLIEDVLEYFYAECQIIDSKQNVTRDLGAIKHLLKKYSLDQVLFGISIASEIFEEIHHILELDMKSYFTKANERIDIAEIYAKEGKIIDYLRY